MKLGLQIPDAHWPGGPAQFGAHIGRVARAADELGFEFIGVPDHVFQVPHLGGPQQDVVECYSTLGFLAAHTTRAKLLAMVTAASYRPPGLLAKMVTTLDVLSGGRAWLGIGAGYYEDEARGLGLALPPRAERFDVLEETLQICLQMWRGDDRPFVGKHFRLERPLNVPPSISQPHPPILIGGGGETRTLRIVARYADACNLYPTPDLGHKLEVLRAHCEAEGREYAAIRKTCMYAFDVGNDGSTSGQLVERLRGLAALGIQTVIGWVPHVYDLKQLEIMGREVIPSLRDV